MFPNLTEFTFKGSASIIIKAFAATDEIIYHRAVSNPYKQTSNMPMNYSLNM